MDVVPVTQGTDLPGGLCAFHISFCSAVICHAGQKSLLYPATVSRKQGPAVRVLAGNGQGPKPWYCQVR